ELTSNGCVAYTFSKDTGKCTLFTEIELESNWLDLLSTGSAQPKTMRTRRDTISRVNVPKPFTVNDQWITTYKVPSPQVLTTYYHLIEITTKTFVGCLNAYADQGYCHQIVYNSDNGKCYVKKSNAETQDDVTTETESRVSVR